MKKVGLLILTLLLTTNTLCSQTGGNGIIPNSWRQNDLTRYSANGVLGNPGIFEEFLPGVIYMTNGQIITGIKLNIYKEDELIISKPYKGYESYYDIEENDIERIEIITGNNENRVFKRYYKTNFQTASAPDGFYEMISGDNSFLKKTYTELMKPEKSDGYSPTRTKTEYVKMTKYYLKNTEQENYQEVRLNKKSISTALGGRASQAKSLMKKNKWKWTNEAHIILLLTQL